MRVFVVWEPVLRSDIAPPTSGDLARCHDPRARQLWDPEGLVSRALVGARGLRRNGLLWDYVALYPPGAVWGDALPTPSFEGSPVVKAADGLRAALLAK